MEIDVPPEVVEWEEEVVGDRIFGGMMIIWMGWMKVMMIGYGECGRIY